MPAYSVFALRCIIGSDIPNDAGSLEPFRVMHPSLHFKRTAPAPVAMRHTLGQMTPDLVYGCCRHFPTWFLQRASVCTICPCGIRQCGRSGHTQFAVELVFNGGTGARPHLDGLSTTAFPSGVWGIKLKRPSCCARGFSQTRIASR